VFSLELVYNFHFFCENLRNLLCCITSFRS